MSAEELTAGERWLRLAAQGGHRSAQARLGARLVQRPEHVAEGIDLLRKAVAHSDRLAQAALGRCYETGTGVERDYAQALALYTPAAAGGNADAKRGLARLYEQGLGVARDGAKARTLYAEADSASGMQP
jgi:TPR repeat protein